MQGNTQISFSDRGIVDLESLMNMARYSKLLWLVFKTFVVAFQNGCRGLSKQAVNFGYMRNMPWLFKA